MPTATKPRASRVVIHFYTNGRAMPASQDKYSSVAWYATRKIDGDAPRISTSALDALLATLGVAEPRSTSWDVTLPNGIMVSARIEGDDAPVSQPATVPVVVPAKSAKPVARPGQTVKPPATKRTAKSSREVTPVPKNGTARKRRAKA